MTKISKISYPNTSLKQTFHGEIPTQNRYHLYFPRKRRKTPCLTLVQCPSVPSSKSQFFLFSTPNLTQYAPFLSVVVIKEAADTPAAPNPLTFKALHVMPCLFLHMLQLNSYSHLQFRSQGGALSHCHFPGWTVSICLSM